MYQIDETTLKLSQVLNSKKAPPGAEAGHIRGVKDQKKGW
jgi:hypothetical protein